MIDMILANIRDGDIDKSNFVELSITNTVKKAIKQYAYKNEEVYISPLLKSKALNQEDKNMSSIENLIKNKLGNLTLKTSYISGNLIYNHQTQDEDLIKLIPEVINSSSIGEKAREAKYRVKYCPNSGNILSFYPTNIKYNNNNIDDEKRVIDGYPFIVIDWKEWQKCINNQQKYKVDLYKKTLMEE
jgi:hypothetical protein